MVQMRECEKLVLRALCCGLLQGDSREQAFRQLARHRFAEPEHELLFAALSTLHVSEASSIREQLPARLVNLGFPDVDLAPFLDAPAPTPAEISEALRRMAAEASGTALNRD